MSDLDFSAKSAGEMLRRARESHGASLEALSSTIKVSVAKLRALEAGDQQTLPDPNFNRALAMTVCRALKIDAAPILAAMPASVATVLTASKPALNEPYRDFADTGLTFDRTAQLGIKLPKIPAAVFASAGLLVVAALIYWVPDRSEWPVFSAFERADPIVAIPVQASAPAVLEQSSEASAPVLLPPRPVSAPESASQVHMAPAAESTAFAGSAASAPMLPLVASKPLARPALSDSASSPSSAKPLSAVSNPVVAVTAPAPQASSAFTPNGRMTVFAKEAAWVEVRDGAGQKVLSRLVQAGESVELRGQTPFKVHAGNAPSLSVQFNGKAVDLSAVTRQNVARIELK